MAKRSNQKLKLLYLQKILMTSAEACRGLTLSEISQELERYGIRAERKTLYDDIEALRLFGLDVRVKRDKRVRYYVGERNISACEMKLIGDAVGASRALSEKERRALLQRLGDVAGREALSLLSAPEQEGLTLEKEGSLKNAELFCKAILENKRLRGRYFLWNSRKQRIMQFEGKTVELSPWCVDLSGDEPAAVVTLLGSDEQLALKTDRFLDLEITDRSREGAEAFLAFRERGGVDALLGKGAPTMLRMRADNSLADKVIGRFGSGITVVSNGEEKFEFSVRAAADASLYAWVLGCAGGVEILAPTSAICEYRRLLGLDLTDKE